MFARIIDENNISQASNSIVVGESIILNPTEAQYNEANYYEVYTNFVMEEVEDPETHEKYYREVPAKEFYHYINHYEQKENKIEQTHIEVKDDEPNRSAMIVEKIRKQYSLDAELAIQRQRENSPEKQADFAQYNSYCEQCKAEVDDYIARWSEA